MSLNNCEKRETTAIACDSAGYEMKKSIMSFLTEKGFGFKDFGAFDNAPTDYPVFAQNVCRAILAGECDRGILICGTGNGISMAANRFRGIRAALCHDVFSAKSARDHNDANIISLGARVIGVGVALECVDAFLRTPFSGAERHQRRVEMIEDN